MPWVTLYPAKVHWSPDLVPMTVTLTGNRVLADKIKVRWVAIQCAWCLLGKRQGGDRGMTRMDGHHQKLGRGQQGFCQNLNARPLDDTLTLDFSPPELWEHKHLLFESPSCDTVMATPGKKHTRSPWSHASNSGLRDVWYKVQLVDLMTVDISSKSRKRVMSLQDSFVREMS